MQDEAEAPVGEAQKVLLLSCLPWAAVLCSGCICNCEASSECHSWPGIDTPVVSDQACVQDDAPNALEAVTEPEGESEEPTPTLDEQTPTVRPTTCWN